MSQVVVAIDGPAGSGKSSVAKAVAARLGYGYLDTGAAYRALTWANQHLAGYAISDLQNKNLNSDFDYQISTSPENFWVKVGDEDVTEDIRTAAVAEQVSEVARIPEVRAYMKSLTRELVQKCELPGIIVEGRDITTVVLPDATKRILLTASEEVRLNRRATEIGQLAASEVARQVSQRDASDSKVVDFLNPAPGVELIDSSDLNFEQTVEMVAASVKQAV